MKNSNLTVKTKHPILDNHFNKYIHKVFEQTNEDTENRWEIYNMIIEELLNSNKVKSIQEIKYRLTDGENINKVMLDIIDKETDTLWFIRRRIEEFIEDDCYKRFYE